MTTAGGRVASACIPVAQRQGATCPVTPGGSRDLDPESESGPPRPAWRRRPLPVAGETTGLRVTAAACQSASTAKGHCKFKFPPAASSRRPGGSPLGHDTRQCGH